MAGALYVAADGVLVSGTTSVTDNGRTIEFVPSAPFAKNALVEVFLEDSAQDLAGNALYPYDGSFRTEVDTSTAAPTVVRRARCMERVTHR